jgi:tyrosyl-tRNA synthetase
MDQKKQLAWQIVSKLHSPTDANQVQQGRTPTDIPEVHVTSRNIIDVLVQSKLVDSKSAARRLIDQHGVRQDQTVITPPITS